MLAELNQLKLPRLGFGTIVLVGLPTFKDNLVEKNRFLKKHRTLFKSGQRMKRSELKIKRRLGRFPKEVVFMTEQVASANVHRINSGLGCMRFFPLKTAQGSMSTSNTYSIGELKGEP